MENWVSVLVSLLVVVAFAAGGYVGYEKGVFDPLIEQFGVMMFKAKAAAEEEKMQAQGEDFIGSELKGNKQASDVVDGVGGIGGLKKQL